MKKDTFKPKRFKTIKVCGKWILAGEYAVLKSYPALAFPLSSQFIELDYQEDKSLDLVRVVESKRDNDFDEKNQHLLKSFSVVSVFESLLNLALQKVSKDRSDLSGIIYIYSHIICGGGIGASAVICVLIGRLFHNLNWLKEEELFSFCHFLENSLHGQSSGLDIAATLSGKPILYTLNSDKKKPKIQLFSFLWRPLIFLSWSGENRSTKDNIKEVKWFWEKEKDKAHILNQQMEKAVLKSKEGLKMANKEKGMLLLIEAFSLAEDCFVQWKLMGTEMQKHTLFLKNQGAVATKPTGSGRGGYVLSLWSQPPPVHLRPHLIPAF